MQQSLRGKLPLWSSALLLAVLLSLVQLKTPAVAQNVNALRLSLWDADPKDENISKVISAYEKEHPTIRIDRTSISPQDYYAKLVASVEHPPDILIVNGRLDPLLIQRGLLADLTSYISTWKYRELYFSGAWSSMMYQGKYYGVPIDSDVIGLFYNKDIFQNLKMEPPTTWDELRTSAKKIATSGHSGLCFSNDSEISTFLPFLWQAGGEIETIGDTASIDALTFLNELVNIDKSTSRLMNSSELIASFSSGNCAMMISGYWLLPLLKAQNVKFLWQTAQLPRNKTSASLMSSRYFAAGKGANVAAAWDVINWMSTPDMLEVIITALPNRKDMAQNNKWANDPELKGLIDQVSSARPLIIDVPAPASESDVINQISMMVSSVLDKQKPSDDAARDAGKFIKSLLQGTPMASPVGTSAMTSSAIFTPQGTLSAMPQITPLAEAQYEINFAPRMKVDESYTVSVQINFDSTNKISIIEIRKRTSNGTQEVLPGQLKFYPGIELELQLQAVSFDVINPTQTHQKIKPGTGNLAWQWQIRPKFPGEQVLTVQFFDYKNQDDRTLINAATFPVIVEDKTFGEKVSPDTVTSATSNFGAIVIAALLSVLAAGTSALWTNSKYQELKGRIAALENPPPKMSEQPQNPKDVASKLLNKKKDKR